jgi:hypothetical protein
MLDLDWFKREVRYCLTPLGMANDRIRQTGGRYRDETDFDFMMRMGVWTENLSLPAVINECLMQSHDGVIRLFPNAAALGNASFRELRAAGARCKSVDRKPGGRSCGASGGRRQLQAPRWSAGVRHQSGRVLHPAGRPGEEAVKEMR